MCEVARWCGNCRAAHNLGKRTMRLERDLPIAALMLVGAVIFIQVMASLLETFGRHI